MYRWSVLKNSLLDEYSKDPEHRSLKQFDMQNILEQIQKIVDQESLYGLASFHRRWHSPLKNRMFFSGLNLLRERFGDFFINMLIWEFSSAAYIPHGHWHEKEADYARLVEEGAADIFPEFTSFHREAVFDGFRIDLLAKESASKRDVLFELKQGALDPTPQLLRYSTHFHDPILIGITEKVLPSHKKHASVNYFTYETLNYQAAENIIKQFGGKSKTIIFSSP